MGIQRTLFVLIVIGSVLVAAPQAHAGTSLADYLRDVRGANPEIRAARQTAEGISAQARASWALDDPIVGVTYYKVPVTGGLSNAMEQMWTVSQTIPFPTTWVLKGSMNRWMAESAQAQSRAAEERVLEMARMAYGDYLMAVEKVEILVHHQTVVRQMSDVARSRYESNQTSQVDYLRAQMELTKMENELWQARREKTAALTALNTLRNRPAGTPIDRVPFESLTATSVGSVEAWQSKARANRPELAGVRAMREQKIAEQKMQVSDYFPDLMVSATRRTAMGTGAVDHDFMFSVNVPLWFFMKENFQAARAGYDAESAGQMVRMMENQTVQEVESAHAAVQSKERTLAVTRSILNVQARQAWRVALRDYEGGMGNFLMVLDTEKEYRNIELEAVMAWADWLKSYAALLRVSGEGRKF